MVFVLLEFWLKHSCHHAFNQNGSTVPLMIKHPFNISKTIGVHGFNLN
jgi:hypothetical protein